MQMQPLGMITQHKLCYVAWLEGDDRIAAPSNAASCNMHAFCKAQMLMCC
jgi:hypothetical protein